MIFDIDTAIVTIFLGLIALTGLIVSRNVNTIKTYAVGDRNFSTGTIAVTLASTWIGGGFFMMTISDTYSDGLYYIILAFCEVLALFIISLFVAPRIETFLGSFSVAEVIGKVYGDKAQILTALIGVARSVGTIAIQFKVCSTILQYCFDINEIYCTILACLLVISYSAAGGVKAVTVTDILQFITFIIFIPILSLIIWNSLRDSVPVMEIIKIDPLFNFTNLSNLSGVNLYNFIALIILFITPGLDPAIFQRVLIAKNAIQAKLSVNIAAFSFLIILILTCWIAILLRASNPGLSSENILGYLIENYTYIGLKGLIIIGVLAMLMSTADSYINSASILIAHDFCVPLNIKWAKNNELLLTKLAAFFLGIFALFLALITNNLLDIIVIMASFYMPLVTVPLFLAIFGFKANTKSYFSGISVGAIITIIGKFTNFGLTGPIITVIAITAVLITILIIHCLNKNLHLSLQKR